MPSTLSCSFKLKIKLYADRQTWSHKTVSGYPVAWGQPISLKHFLLLTLHRTKLVLVCILENHTKCAFFGCKPKNRQRILDITMESDAKTSVIATQGKRKKLHWIINIQLYPQVVTQNKRYNFEQNFRVFKFHKI